MQNEIAIKKLRKQYSDFSLQIDDLSIKQGEILAIIGPSGSGKSSLLKSLGGIIKIDQGEILINQQDLSKLPIHKRNMSYVFQEYALFPHLNLKKNIGFGLKARKIPKKQRDIIIQDLLSNLELEGLENKMPWQLSGGQQQRTALARALAVKPDLLLLDEPLSALDEDLRKNLRFKIKSWIRQYKSTALYVTHDQQEALQIADRILLLRNGKIEQLASPQEIFYNPATLFSAGFFGHSNQIMGKLKSSTQEGLLQIANKIFKAGRTVGRVNKEQKGVLFFRPQDAKIIDYSDLKKYDLKYNIFQGTILRSFFSGSINYHLLQSKECGELLCQSSSNQKYALGEELILAISAEKCIIFAL